MNRTEDVLSVLWFQIEATPGAKLERATPEACDLAKRLRLAYVKMKWNDTAICCYRDGRAIRQAGGDTSYMWFGETEPDGSLKWVLLPPGKSE